MQLNKVLVPVDFSECSKRALEYACEIASKFGASVDVLHVWFTPAYISPSVAVQVAKGESEALELIAVRQAEDQMNAFIDKVTAPDGVAIEPRIEYGYEPKKIIEVASDYDLVVMGTRGREGISRVLLGSVAENVVRHAPCPVLCVRDKT